MEEVTSVDIDSILKAVQNIGGTLLCWVSYLRERGS